MTPTNIGSESGCKQREREQGERPTCFANRKKSPNVLRSIIRSGKLNFCSRYARIHSSVRQATISHFTISGSMVNIPQRDYQAKCELSFLSTQATAKAAGLSLSICNNDVDRKGGTRHLVTTLVITLQYIKYGGVVSLDMYYVVGKICEVPKGYILVHFVI